MMLWLGLGVGFIVGAMSGLAAVIFILNWGRENGRAEFRYIPPEQRG